MGPLRMKWEEEHYWDEKCPSLKTTSTTPADGSTILGAFPELREENGQPPKLIHHPKSRAAMSQSIAGKTEK